MPHSVNADTVMENENYNVDVRNARLGRADPSGEFELSPNLRARIETLAPRRINASQIKFPEGARELRGGHGLVSEARMGRPKTAKERVAIKNPMIGDNKDLERVVGLAVREAEFLAELTHPNIVRFKGFVENVSKGIIWLVFPWADYGNLRDFVASEKWEVLERISLISDVVNGLAYLHSRESPICHGDLKSLNVLVFGRGKCRATITDFGSARHLAGRDLRTQIEEIGSQTQSPQPLNAAFCPSTNTITLTGNNYSLRWAAPELLIEDQLTLWSDIWALGWIAYEVMTNSLPFQDVTSDVLVVERVLGGDLPSLADNAQLALVHELCSLMTRRWDSNPTKRPTADSCRKSIKRMPMWAPKMGVVKRVVPVDLLSKLGLLYQSRGDFARAFGHFADALEKSRELGDENKLVTNLSNLARLHRLRKEYNEAVALYSEVWEIYARSKYDYSWEIIDGLSDLAKLRRLRNKRNKATKVDSESRKIQEERIAQALCKIAQHRTLLPRSRTSILLYSEALEICNYLGDRRARADALLGLARAYKLRNELDEAIRLYSEVLEIQTDLGDREGRLKTLWVIAEARQYQNQYDKAIPPYSEVVKIQTDPSDKKGRLDALWVLAQVYQHQHDYSEAIGLYSEVLEILTDLGHRKGKADALVGLAQVHRLQYQYDWAILLYYDALQICTDLGDMKARADTLRDLAEVNGLQQQYDQAIRLYSEVWEIRSNLGDRKGEKDTLEVLVQVYLTKKQCAATTGLCLGALEVSPDLSDTKRVANALSAAAKMHRCQYSYSEAIRLYSEVLDIRTKLGDREGRANALCNLAQLHQLQRWYDQAIRLYSEALEIRTDFGDGEGRADALWGLAQVHHLQRQYDQAMLLYCEVLQIRTNLERQ